MKCVILQPSYIPWRGYFHQIQKSDLFIFYDDVQFDKRGWRHRNRIKTPKGSDWLTIPVLSKGHQTHHTPINDISICWDRPWNEKHWGAIQSNYQKAPFFQEYISLLRPFYESHPDSLANYTIDSTIAISQALGINNTQFVRSSHLPAIGNKTDRLLSLLKYVGADHYISGPSARDYIEEEKFREANIVLEYMSYDYPEYKQLYPPFDPQVSIIDLLFMTGAEAPKYIWDINTNYTSH